jgi:hypothetical protein
MKFLRRTPDRNARLGTILALIVVLAIFGVVVIYSPGFQRGSANAGFGADWECTPQLKGDPVCIKKPGR